MGRQPRRDPGHGHAARKRQARLTAAGGVAALVLVVAAVLIPLSGGDGKSSGRRDQSLLDVERRSGTTFSPTTSTPSAAIASRPAHRAQTAQFGRISLRRPESRRAPVIRIRPRWPSTSPRPSAGCITRSSPAAQRKRSDQRSPSSWGGRRQGTLTGNGVTITVSLVRVRIRRPVRRDWRLVSRPGSRRGQAGRQPLSVGGQATGFGAVLLR